MLFGKKKAAPENPYYPNNTPQSQVNPPMPTADAVQPTQDQQPSQAAGPFPVPLLPTPEPITLPNLDVGSLKVSNRLTALDIMKMGPETKSFAFVKLSDFKRIVDDIKSLESKINDSQDDLEEFSKILKEQEEYLNRYASVIKDLRRTIEEIASSLSRVED